VKRRHLLGAAAGACIAPAIAQPAPRMAWPELRLLDGSPLSATDWSDVAAVVVVFATWCPFCQRHNAHVEALHRAHAGAHLRVIGAAIDRDEAAVRRYLQRQGLSFPVTMQGAQLRDRARASPTIPTTIVVDRAGHLRTPIPGEMFREDVLELAALAQSHSVAYHR
jgi:thiol-disulfide isomerase/thioredoxin